MIIVSQCYYTNKQYSWYNDCISVFYTFQKYFFLSITDDINIF